MYVCGYLCVCMYMYIRVSQKTKILGAQVFPILFCPKSPNMTKKNFSVIIKRYMSNLKIVILRPWTEQFVINLLSSFTVHGKRSITKRFALRVQSGSVGSG